ncbi:MAG: hypothetical protein U0572_12580 [Phycisphaerales bacterium]
MNLDEFLTQVGDMLIGREHGPLHLRLVLQPLVAVTLAIHSGLRDAREGRPPYFFWGLVTEKSRRAELIRLAWKDVGKVFCVAIVLDVIYELIVWRAAYPTQAMIVAFVLAILPYLALRGPVTRIARRWFGVRPQAATEPASTSPQGGAARDARSSDGDTAAR